MSEDKKEVEIVIEEKIPKRFIVDTESLFFDKIYNQVCKQIRYPKEQVTITTINQRKSNNRKQEVKEAFRFVFDYPDNNDEIVGVEVFYEGEVK